MQGHSAEPVMLWTEAILNPAGPPRVHSDWPEVPYLDHIVAHDKEGRCFKVPYTTSKEVAKAWEVDHSTLCGKLLGHRRRKWKDTNTPPLFYLWRMGSSPYTPLGVALMPVWSNQRIAYVQWNPGGRKRHPKHVGPRAQDAGLPDGLLSEGGDAPLRGPMA